MSCVMTNYNLAVQKSISSKHVGKCHMIYDMNVMFSTSHVQTSQQEYKKLIIDVSASSMFYLLFK